MQLAIMEGGDLVALREYVLKKFKIYDGWSYTAATRRQKAISYYQAASPAGKAIVKDVYFRMFKEPFPTIPPQKAIKEVRRVEASEWRRTMMSRLGEAKLADAELKRMLKAQDYQLGEMFFDQLQQTCAFLNKDIFHEEPLETTFEARRVSELTGKRSVEGLSASADFDGMIGFKQNAGIAFQTRERDWGQISAKLEQSFRAGAWTRGSAKAELGKLNFDAEVEFAIAMGLQFEVEGKLAWKKGDVGLELGGKAEFFGGASAEGSAKLSIGARSGLQAAISAEAFAGFRASATGSCAFTYQDQAIITATGTASVTVGAGAKFEAAISCPLFGPTEISFASELTVGIGTGAECSLEIDFNGAYLAGKDSFRKLVYLRTISRGYGTELMRSDAKNKLYLDKAIVRVTEEIKSLEGWIASYDRVARKKPEEQALLMDLD